MIRVALFADSFLEVNGVANTCRHLAALAARQGAPFLVVHGGEATEITVDASVTRCQLRRGPSSFLVDRDFRYDPLFYRHARRVRRLLREFSPDLIHITGPGDAGTLGRILARQLRLPLCASWHTNLHQYAATRLGGGRIVERAALAALGWFYRPARAVLAPNPELLQLVTRLTRRPGFLMGRGVDIDLFTPARRRRTDDQFVIGYVGRLTAEKNVRLFGAMAGIENCRLLLIGDGAERDWLAQNLPSTAQLPGVLQGEALAEAYAGMDLFAFPSRTDTFGNVVLEALASGVPAVVTSQGGPRHIVREGETGFVAETDADFVRRVTALAANPAPLAPMREAARRQALATSWDAVWDQMQVAWRATVSGT